MQHWFSWTRSLTHIATVLQKLLSGWNNGKKQTGKSKLQENYRLKAPNDCIHTFFSLLLNWKLEYCFKPISVISEIELSDHKRKHNQRNEYFEQVSYGHFISEPWKNLNEIKRSGILPVFNNWNNYMIQTDRTWNRAKLRQIVMQKLLKILIFCLSLCRLQSNCKSTETEGFSEIF